MPDFFTIAPAFNASAISASFLWIAHFALVHAFWSSGIRTWQSSSRLLAELWR
jgi:hypothetical protein